MATFFGPTPTRVEIVNGNTIMADFDDPAKAMALKEALEFLMPGKINPADFIPYTGTTTPNPE